MIQCHYYEPYDWECDTYAKAWDKYVRQEYISWHESEEYEFAMAVTLLLSPLYLVWDLSDPLYRWRSINDIPVCDHSGMERVGPQRNTMMGGSTYV